MPDSSEALTPLAEKLLLHPQGEALKTVAHKITDLVFDVRKNLVFSEILGNPEIDPDTKKSLLELMGDFRTQARALPLQEIPESNDELYRQIILPLVTHQINGSR